ncbi:MAG: DUF3048 domain-containing protein [Clostridiales bacterium]|jgi:hypothetical protein|nr:DUF3048 domain-containing protein [Clostridiales bacterium]
MKRSVILPALIASLAIGLASCGKGKDGVSEDIGSTTSISHESTSKISEKPEASQNAKQQPEIENGVPDPLTGLLVEEERAASRPMAIVINNHNKALPQSGIGQAAICYEVLAEGNITRIVAIFHGADAQKIGPVRSARHYFIDFAFDYDCIFIHHGGSYQAYDALADWGIASLDAMTLPGATFWRDPERVNVPGMFEHSSYTGSDLLKEAAISKGIRTQISQEKNIGFEFFEKSALLPGSKPAAKIEVPFDSGYEAGFLYDAAKGVYLKTHSGAPHMDDASKEQLSVENVVIQRTSIYLIPGDEAGRREVKTIGEGTGLLATRGGYAPISWRKDSHSSPTRFFFEDGSEMRMNKGKTWICVISNELEIEIS